MLALRKTIVGPGAELRHIELPRLKPGELRLAVEAVGICGTDLHIVDWHGGYEAMASAMPVTLGHEIAARVISGDGLAPGTRVVVRPSVTCEMTCQARADQHEDQCTQRTGLGIRRDGGFAAEMIAPRRNCVPVPAHLTSAHAALTEPLTVSHEAARNAALRPGDRVLVVGPGPIGLGAALFARECGADVVVAGRHDVTRLAVARALGFARSLDIGEDTLDEALAKAGHAEPFQAIIEATGSPDVLRQTMLLLAPHGRMVIAGIHPRPVDIDVTRMVRQHQSLVGSYRAPVSTWQGVMNWIEAHPEWAEHLISARLPLEKIEDGFQLMRRRSVVKVIIEPQSVT